MHLCTIGGFNKFCLSSSIRILGGFTPLLSSPCVFTLRGRVNSVRTTAFKSRPGGPCIRGYLDCCRNHRFVGGSGACSAFPLPGVLGTRLGNTRCVGSCARVGTSRVGPRVLPVSCFDPGSDNDNGLAGLAGGAFSVRRFGNS